MAIFSIRVQNHAQTILEGFYGQFSKIIDFQWNFTMGRLSLISLEAIIMDHMIWVISHESYHMTHMGWSVNWLHVYFPSDLRQWRKRQNVVQMGYYWSWRGLLLDVGIFICCMTWFSSSTDQYRSFKMTKRDIKISFIVLLLPSLYRLRRLSDTFIEIRAL